MKIKNSLRVILLLTLFVFLNNFDRLHSVMAQALEVYHVEILGVERLDITDSKGRTNNQISFYLDNAVPGVDYEYGSAASDEYIFPHTVRFANNAIFDIKFKTTSVAWRSITITRGTQRDSPSLAIRYLDFPDLGIPAGVNAWLRFTPRGVSDLSYDRDGNGTFETIVKPQFSVTGGAARDITEPIVKLSSEISGNVATVTITATDNETGLKNLHYRTEDTEPKVYGGPFKIDVSRPRVVFAFADDVAGNRRIFAKEFNLDPAKNSADPFKLRSIPF